jgi:hypothetical protein
VFFVNGNTFPADSGNLPLTQNIFLNYSLFTDIINPSDVSFKDFPVSDIGPYLAGPAFQLTNTKYLFCLGIFGQVGTEWNYIFTLVRLIPDGSGGHDAESIPEGNYIYGRRFAAFPIYLSHQTVLVRVDDPGYYIVAIGHSTPATSANVTLSFTPVN